MTLILQDTLTISPATVNKIEGEIEDLKGATDCADIVQSKADLNNYDKSKLTDQAIVKVLQDESKSGAETYYRYTKSSNSFTFIGELGPYYTKSEDDTLLAGKVDKVTSKLIVYGTNGSGNPTTYGVSVNNTDDTVPRRTDGGQVRVAQTPNNDTDATSKKYVDNALANKQYKPTLIDITGLSVPLSVADNCIYNGGEFATLTFQKPLNAFTTDYSAQVNFTSGSTPTIISVTGDVPVVWSGDNVNENTGFQPRANCRYSIMFTYDGVNWRGLISGVSL
ncbi:MAG: hypothetical protein J5691_00645 [Bacilli bacterium]|nr:hypothetical protein [Bacilli bacterium]